MWKPSHDNLSTVRATPGRFAGVAHDILVNDGAGGEDGTEGARGCQPADLFLVIAQRGEDIAGARAARQVLSAVLDPIVYKI
jgi:hypothetical protein